MLHRDFVKPAYGGSCFVDVPHAIAHVLTQACSPRLSSSAMGSLMRPYEKVVCFFLDAFGWRFVKDRIDDYPFLQEIEKQGHIAQLTSQFPSTTAAHMTAFHTGLSPAESGVYEWQYYEPTLDRLICPLPFSFAGDRGRDGLLAAGVVADDLLPASPLYALLEEHEVSVVAYMPQEYTNSPYSKRVIGGAQRRPMRTFAEGLTNAAEELLGTDGPLYMSLYHPDIDSICHKYGPSSSQVEAEIDATLTMLERLFMRKLQGQAKDTLLLLTADHGQVDVSPEQTTYLNLDERFAALPGMLRKNRQGELLVPAGSCRDMFLYAGEGMVDEIVGCLREPLEGIAEVVPTQVLIDEGYFGTTAPCEAFLSRVGDVVILPFAGEAVWWYEKGKFEQTKLGHHGGLTREEMEIPLLAYGF